MDRKTKKRLETLRRKLQTLRQQLAGARRQVDDPADLHRLPSQIATVEEEMKRLRDAAGKR